MQFIPYPSFENHCNAKTVSGILRTALNHPEVEWVAIEKVHGANFQMTTDGKEIKCGKRTAFVSEDENKEFFGFMTVLTHYRAKVLDLFDRIKSTHPTTQFVTLFGELFGNGYVDEKSREKENERHCTANKPVQREIHYCPHLEFYAFDIRVQMEISKNGETKKELIFLGYDESISLWQACGFLYAKPLKRGTFQEMYDFDVENLVSWIPNHFCLPPLQNNFAEGIVIKPVQPITNKYLELYLKKKQTKFVEVHRGKAPKNFHRKLDITTTNDNIQSFVEDVLCYVTENRLVNLISKHGTGMQPKEKVGRLMADVIQDWKKADDSNNVILNAMSKPQRNLFYQSLMAQCEILCKK